VRITWPVDATLLICVTMQPLPAVKFWTRLVVMLLMLTFWGVTEHAPDAVSEYVPGFTRNV
jgi:hypothetical protein